MTPPKLYSLCEAVADIAYISAENNYRTNDSREMISQFIQWAMEFERIHQNIKWGINAPYEYMEAIWYFTIFKIESVHNSEITF